MRPLTAAEMARIARCDARTVLRAMKDLGCIPAGTANTPGYTARTWSVSALFGVSIIGPLLKRGCDLEEAREFARMTYRVGDVDLNRLMTSGQSWVVGVGSSIGPVLLHREHAETLFVSHREQLKVAKLVPWMCDIGGAWRGLVDAITQLDQPAIGDGIVDVPA